MQSRSSSFRKAILLAVVGILVVALCAFATGCGKKQESSSSASSVSSNSSSSSTMANRPHENFTVKDVKVELNGLNAPKITCTITNNTDFIFRDVSINVTGTFNVKDNYGDTKTDTESLDVFCVTSGYANDSKINYVLPGDNTAEFIPEKQDNIVAYYDGGKGDRQLFTLADATDVQIKAQGGTSLDAQQYDILDKSQYELSLNMSEKSGDKYVSGTITNKTDYKWKEVVVSLVAVTKDGSFAKLEGKSPYDTSLNTYAFNVEPLKATYMKPGTTEQLSSSEYLNGLNVDHFEIASVFVTKDTDK